VATSQVAFDAMSPSSFLLLLVVAGVCGAIGQSLAGYSRSGCLASIILGFIGALLGTWVAHLMKLPEIFTVRVGNESFPVVWSVVGSALFVAVIGFFRRR
jgi:uncharacterized membrane protein YeaQ/YmgE (transglycosylase-associated protein family)